MRRRWLLVVTLVAVMFVALFVWQLPTLLKMIPSRYVARLPEPIQAIGVRDHVEVLPTAAAKHDVGGLLSPVTAAEIPTRESIPASPTPPPTAGAYQVASPAPTVSSSSTPTAVPAATATAASLPVSYQLTGVEHRIQTWNNCGPATLSMALSYFDIYQSQEEIAGAIKPDPEDRNVSPEEMAGYVTEHTGLRAISRTNGSLQTLRQLVSEDIPVIVEYGLLPENEYRWLDWMGHYLLVVAYDDDQETVWVYDSWPRTGEIPDENFVFEELPISYQELDSNWQAFNRNYIAIYREEQTQTVAEIVGENMDDAVMWQNALKVVQQELNDDLENAFLWFDLGTIFNAQGDYEKAATAFDQARSIGLPWRMLWYQFGPYEAYFQTGRYEDVILLADVTLKDRPYFEESYYYKAIALRELGELKEARENLQRAVNFNPNFTPARVALEELELASH
ncbi:MAG TPA: C39 family peptidase [Candidatus Binatia bacterium]|jgi:tetratricopeptide (TPR) repeat protein|nr:C39 family peptidase [Candidatus Binatia bacterium]